MRISSAPRPTADDRNPNSGAKGVTIYGGSAQSVGCPGSADGADY